MQADKKAAELKKQRSLEEFDAFMAKANDIEVSQGKAARDAYEKQYQIDKLEKEGVLNSQFRNTNQLYLYRQLKDLYEKIAQSPADM